MRIMKKVTPLMIVCFISAMLFNACKHDVVPPSRGLVNDDFFKTDIIVQNGKLIASATAFDNPVSPDLKNPDWKEQNESWVKQAIEGLKTFEERDRYVARIKKNVGQPVWNESLVFIGGDGRQTVLTPLYTATAKVNGAIIGSFGENGEFNAQILSRDFAMKHLRDTARNIRNINKSTLRNLFLYFQTKGNSGNVIQAETSTTPVDQSPGITVGNLEFVYTVCYYVPILVYAPSTVVFQKQCHQEVFWGTLSEWDYYYENGDFISRDDGYYVSYDENEIEKGLENIWERLHIDTIAINNNPCLTRLVRGIMGNATNDWAKMVKNFFTSSFGYPDLSQAHNVSFKVASLGSTIVAVTKTGNYSYNSEITVNSDMFSGCSDLFAANTVIHEFTHALMQQMLAMHNIGDSIQRSNFDTCFNMYIDWLYGETAEYKFNGNLGNHEYMAGQLVDIMAAALAEFDNNTRDAEYYWNLSWCGLDGTKTWKYYEQHPMTSESQKNHSEYWQVPHWNWSYALTADRMAAINAIIYDEKEHRSGSESPLHNWANCY
jgi:hypothetical protein